MPNPSVEAIAEQIRSAAAARTPLRIRGGGSKDFYGEPWRAGLADLDLRPLAGISSYEPSELVVSVRAGTPLAELEAALAERGQCLPFEPPRFAAGGPVGGDIAGVSAGASGGTVGGMVAAGLSGPARAAVGSLRDYVLGATMLDGRGELLSFGGQVMKNVAGYDVARVLAGSLGVLGVICEVSLKVLPLPAAAATIRFEWDQARALKKLAEWGGQPWPIVASAWWEGMLVLRLAGAAAAVETAVARLGGEVVPPPLAEPFWRGLRDHRDEFFGGALKAVAGGATLWRLSVPQTTPPLALSGELLVEWGGAQRWLCTSAAAAAVREAAQAVGGHATIFRSADAAPRVGVGVFAPLAPPLMRIHRELKKAFDPAGILNPGRLYPEL